MLSYCLFQRGIVTFGSNGRLCSRRCVCTSLFCSRSKGVYCRHVQTPRTGCMMHCLSTNKILVTTLMPTAILPRFILVNCTKFIRFHRCSTVQWIVMRINRYGISVTDLLHYLQLSHLQQQTWFSFRVLASPYWLRRLDRVHITMIEVAQFIFSANSSKLSRIKVILISPKDSFLLCDMLLFKILSEEQKISFEGSTTVKRPPHPLWEIINEVSQPRST